MTLFPAPILRPGWHRVRNGLHAHHPSRWSVRYCGHATAIHPYFAQSPDGKPVAANQARAFDTVKEAKDVVEDLIDGRLRLTEHPSREGWWIPEGL